jgi:transcriptional regulator with XRE-family HTH domain
MTAVRKPETSPKVDLDSPAAGAAALRTFWKLAEAWELSAAEQATLLGVGRTTLYQWKQGKVGSLDRHLLERLSYLFGIYAALQILFPLARRANEWLRKPNAAPVFGGRSALERMLGGQVADLFVVRQYLDAQRGGKA